MRILSIIIICFLLSPITFAADKKKTSTVYDITAIDGQLSNQSKDNVRLYIENIKPSSPKTLGNWQLQLRQSAEKALQALGYYQPKIIMSTQYDNLKYLATLKISQGIATTISTLDISLKGMAQHDPEFARIIENSQVQLGTQFNHGDYQGLKNSISDIAITRGYFQARWLTKEVKIDESLSQAKVTLVFDSGSRFKFGEIVFQRENPAKSLILSMRTFENNDFYHSDQLARYNLALGQSKYFSGIEVFPDLQKAKDNIIPININLIEKAANLIEVGGGVSSNYGLRGRLKWTKPWFNKYGHSLVSELKLATIEQSFSSTYKIPIEDPIANYATVAVGWQNVDNNDTRTTKYSLQLQRHQLLTSRWKRATFIRFEREDSQQGEQRKVSTNIIPGVSFARTRLRGGLTPHWGDRQSLTLEFGHQGWGSDTNLAKFKVRSKWLRSYNIDHQFIATTDLAAIWAKSIEDVPASMRLFGGGDANLRAYDFDSVAPLDENNELIGGRYQTNLSLEYSYLFLDNWRIATFVDTGTTTNDFSESLKTDVGIGVRWLTPIGPIKLDFAFGLTKDADNEDFDRPFRISFSIGPEL